MKKEKMLKQKKQLLVGVRSESELFDELEASFKLAEKGLPTSPVEHLYFESPHHLWRKLTPRRLELVHALRQYGAMSIRKLAFVLARDYKSVHRDVQILLPLDLVQKDDAGLVLVPWDSILIDLHAPRAAA